MKKFLFVAILCLLFHADCFNVEAIAHDTIVSEAEQKARDTQRATILLQEQASEKALLEQKQQFLALAEATNDSRAVDALTDEIAQHKTNLELLSNELNALETVGGRKRVALKTSTRGNGITQAGSPPEWWDTYSRNSEITKH